MQRYMVLILMLLTTGAKAQRILSEQEVVDKALLNNKGILADSFSVIQQQHLVRSSVNIPNPEFFWESPTGTFYTGSITQSIEFPTVYTGQRKIQQQRVALAVKEKAVTEAELRLQVRLLYLQLQVAIAREKQLALQDSLYSNIQSSVKRQFEAGQVDYLQQLFVETQYGEIHSQLLAAGVRTSSYRRQLMFLANIQDSFIVSDLEKFAAPIDVFQIQKTAEVINNANLSVLEQNHNIAQSNVNLQRSKALPGLAFGYFNQGDRSTSLQYRFRFGITIPVWFWQYSGNIRAARAEQEVSKYRIESYKQQAGLKFQELQNELEGNLKVLSYLENAGLRKAKEMIRAAERLFTAGEVDYIGYLRNTTEAYSIQQRYLDALTNYNASVLQLKFLIGQL